MSDPSPIDRLVARDEIRQLVARYAVAMDARDLDAVVALFVDDVRLGRGRQGRAALADDFAHALRAMPLTILNVGTHVIEIDDADHGRGVVYCRGEMQLADTWVVQMIQYRDTYERRDGDWLFARRQHLLWYGRAVGTSPLGLPPAHWPEHDTGWGEPETWAPWRPPETG
ncbi:MAG TPA: nuclear transport factor 2 family protein [Acidimicrobiia bacterium]|nr:nuclear transport factor 2 family protein [Acidimicrobiia bacterium]